MIEVDVDRDKLLSAIFSEVSLLTTDIISHWNITWPIPYTDTKKNVEHYSKSIDFDLLNCQIPSQYHSFHLHIPAHIKEDLQNLF